MTRHEIGSSHPRELCQLFSFAFGGKGQSTEYPIWSDGDIFEIMPSGTGMSATYTASRKPHISRMWCTYALLKEVEYKNNIFIYLLTYLLTYLATYKIYLYLY